LTLRVHVATLGGVLRFPYAQHDRQQVAVSKDARVLRAMLASIEREHRREPARPVVALTMTAGRC